MATKNASKASVKKTSSLRGKAATKAAPSKKTEAKMSAAPSAAKTAKAKTATKTKKSPTKSAKSPTKTAAKKSPSKTTAAKKTPPKKSPAKTSAKKTPAKPAAKKPAAKKTPAKKAPAKKPAAKKAPAKKAPAKKAAAKTPAKKAAAKKAPAKKAPAKKAPAKPAAKKTPEKKAPAKKPAAKKTPAKKAPAKKPAAKKAPAKKAPAKKAAKAPAKKPEAKKTPAKKAPAKKAPAKTEAKKTPEKKAPAKKPAAKKTPAKKTPAKKAPAKKPAKAEAAKDAEAKAETKAASAKPKAKKARATTRKRKSTRSKSANSETKEKKVRRVKKALVNRSESDLLLDRAQRCIRLRDFNMARQIFERVITDYPEDIRGSVYYAKFKATHGQREEALKEFNRALRRSPRSVLALAGKAEFLENQNPPKSLNDAIKIYNSILEDHQDSEEADAEKHREFAKDRLRYCEARKLSLQSRKHMKPDNPRSLRKARKLLHEALELYPDDKRNSMNLGVAYLWSKDYDNAQTYCNEAIRKDPKYARAYLNLGHAYNGLSHLKRARDAYRSCLELTMNSRDADEARSTLKTVERRMAQCRTMFQNALQGRLDKKNMPNLNQMKNMVTMLTGDDIERGDVASLPEGSYTVLAYSTRNRYQVTPGPEGLKIVRDALTHR